MQTSNVVMASTQHEHVLTQIEPGPFHSTTQLSGFRKRCQQVIEHLAFQILTILLILTDVIIVVYIIARGNDDHHDSTLEALDIVCMVFASYFVIEVVARIYVKGLTVFFKNYADIFDCVIVLASFVMTAVCLIVDFKGEGATKVIIVGRVVRIIIFFIRIIVERRRHVQKASRLMVSQNKRRYRQDGFDLDLCYVTDRVIAMSFPASGIMSFYRNPIKEVARFFDMKHPNHYRIYNLCSERMYDESLFHYNVVRVYVDDHNVPKLEELLKFVDDVRQWLEKDSGNVIAVHCKGGKGRTGTMISTWLLDSGQFDKAQEGLKYFGEQRTDLSVGTTFQGVETPSQSRYVGYYEVIIKEYDRKLPPVQSLSLKKIIVHQITGVGKGNGSDLVCTVTWLNYVREFNIGAEICCKTKLYNNGTSLEINLDDIPKVTSDVKVKFYCESKSVPVGYDGCAFYFWFHTSFVTEKHLNIPREQLDNPHKPHTWHIYREGFGVELIFD